MFQNQESDNQVHILKKLLNIDDFDSAKSALVDLKKAIAHQEELRAAKSFIEKPNEDCVYHKAQEMIQDG